MSESRICPVCENDIPEDAGFCPHCDFELKWLDDEEAIQDARENITGDLFEVERQKPEELDKPSIKMDNGKFFNSTMVILLIISIVNGGLSIWSNINCWMFDCMAAAFAAPVYISFCVGGIVYSYINLFRKKTKIFGKILFILNLTLCIVAVNWLFIRNP